MGRKSYDEEDHWVARQLYGHRNFRGWNWCIDQMQKKDPARYSTMHENTLRKWYRDEKGSEYDWDKRRRDLRLKEAKRMDELADIQAEDILDQTLKNMIEIQKKLSEKILGKKGERGEGEDLKAKELDINELSTIANTYNKSVEKALSILKGKIKEVDLNRLSVESQVFFIRLMFEDIGQIAEELDEKFGMLFKMHSPAILARMRNLYKDQIITEVQDDLCLDKLLKRAGELNDRDRNKKNSDKGRVAGAVGKAADAAA